MNYILVYSKEILYYFFVKFPTIIIGKIKGNLVYTHWGRGLNNFGDCLSPDILRHYGFTPVFSNKLKADITLAGSILQWLPQEYNGIILGTGGDNVRYCFPNAQILGVRGKYTKMNMLERSKNIILGDPGLIMNYVYPSTVDKKHKLGIVPHFVDKQHRIIEKWAMSFGNKITIINVLDSPKNVIQKIKECDYILSSSLHGLIIADSFNIPNVRFVIRETMPTPFYDYKFQDYYSSLNSEAKTIEATGEERFKDIISKTRLHTMEVEAIQRQLDLKLRELSSILDR